ncbi:hypothetical protein TVAG_372530 [Trichomonas vaginalis G3]|uniref:Ankyrin repeat protein n=1 Tax=Trichomonas vaginalis (strain ATCC PRA-98 / G3) TaxID=412133 RepID=A2EYZ6_TRIV3|nr:ankyrin repeat and DEATH domain-containing protein family [Trichomonas vaginalis G3]EAY02108.1 hypothetical protein TVAG_372530 [Trichomonas vaginalis G3]KAI5532750.1 ankyrin repeat and DEATH domain-containing protein family [Trichomonas vaginalis G3]|eukprot:XP_001314500.1 hypothetical protein [Trichomonas vaginalis G3]
MFALIAKNYEVVQWMASKRCGVNDLNFRGYTPLMISIESLDQTGFDILIQFSDIHTKNSQDGCTALHIAALVGNLYMIKKLIEKGLKDEPDNYQRTPSYIAEQMGFSEAANFIKNSSEDSSLEMELGLSSEESNNKIQQPFDLSPLAIDNTSNNSIPLIEDGNIFVKNAPPIEELLIDDYQSTTFFGQQSDSPIPSLSDHNIQLGFAPTDLSIQQELPQFDVSFHKDLPPMDASLNGELPPIDASLTGCLPPIDSNQTELPPIESNQQTELPPIDTSLNGELPPIESNQTELPPIESNQTELPPIESNQTELPPIESNQTELPPIESNQQKELPPIDTSLNVDLPPIDSNQQTELPPIESDQQTELPLIDASLTGELPPIDASLNGDLPPIESNQQTELPPIDASLNGDLPPIESNQQTELPPIESDQQTELPLIDASLTGELPPIDASLNVDLPPIESDQQTELPLIDASLTGELPPIDASLNVDLPPIDSNQQTELPPIDASLTGSLPPIESNQTELPPIESNQQIELPPIDTSLNVDLPPIDSNQQTELPPIDASLTGSLPPIESNQTELPPIDSNQQTLLPPIDSNQQSELPQIETSLKGELQPIESNQHTDLSPTDSKQQIELPPIDASLNGELPPIDSKQKTELVPCKNEEEKELPHHGASLAGDLSLIEKPLNGDLPPIESNQQIELPPIETSLNGELPSIDIKQQVELQSTENEVVPSIDSNQQTELPPIETSLKGEPPSVVISSEKEHLPIDINQQSELTPIEMPVNQELPPIVNNQQTELSPLDISLNGKNPPIDNNHQADSPPIEANVNKELPQIEASSNEELPPIDNIQHAECHPNEVSLEQELLPISNNQQINLPTNQISEQKDPLPNDSNSACSSNSEIPTSSPDNTPNQSLQREVQQNITNSISNYSQIKQKDINIDSQISEKIPQESSEINNSSDKIHQQPIIDAKINHDSSQSDKASYLSELVNNKKKIEFDSSSQNEDVSDTISYSDISQPPTKIIDPVQREYLKKQIVFVIENKQFDQYYDFLRGNVSEFAFAAFELGSSEALKILYNIGYPINIKNQDNETLLHAASKNNRTQLVTALLALGIDVNVRSNENKSALYLAIEHGNVEITKLLLENGARISENGMSELDLAMNNRGKCKKENEIWFIMRKHFNIVSSVSSEEILTFLKSGDENYLIQSVENGLMQLDAKDEDDNTLLHWSAAAGLSKLSNYLIEHEADINTQNSMKKTPLHFAALKNMIETAKLLINKYAQLIADSNGDSPIEYAKKEEMKQLLMNYGKKLLYSMLNDHKNLKKLLNTSKTLRSEYQNQILCEVIKSKFEKSVLMLLKNNANVNFRDQLSSNNTILHLAVLSNNETICKIVLKYHPLILTNSDGKYPQDLCKNEEITKIIKHEYKKQVTNLDKIIKQDDSEQLNELLSKGFDPEFAMNGFHLIHIATSVGATKCVVVLCQNGAKNSKTKKGDTAVEIAVSFNQIEIFETLIRAGFKPHKIPKLYERTKDENMKKMIDLYKDFYTAIKYLDDEKSFEETFEKKKEFLTKFGGLLLMKAVESKAENAVKYLLQNNIDPKYVDIYGNSPVHYAALSGNEAIIKILAQYKADMNCQNRKGVFPLVKAVQKRNIPVISLLISLGASSKLQFEGDSLIQYATKLGFDDVVDLLKNIN